MGIPASGPDAGEPVSRDAAELVEVKYVLKQFINVKGD